MILLAAWICILGFVRAMSMKHIAATAGVSGSLNGQKRTLHTCIFKHKL